MMCFGEMLCILGGNGRYTTLQKISYRLCANHGRKVWKTPVTSPLGDVNCYQSIMGECCKMQIGNSRQRQSCSVNCS